MLQWKKSKEAKKKKINKYRPLSFSLHISTNKRTTENELFVLDMRLHWPDKLLFSPPSP